MGASPADRFAAVLDLYQFAVDQMRANLRRRFPGLRDEELEKKLAHWLMERRCAPDGDSVGVLRKRSIGPK
jgi:hypothetical protein